MQRIGLRAQQRSPEAVTHGRWLLSVVQCPTTTPAALARGPPRLFDTIMSTFADRRLLREPFVCLA